MPIGYAGMKETSKGVFEDSGIAVGPSYTGKGYGKQILCVLLNQAPIGWIKIFAFRGNHRPTERETFYHELL